MKKGMCQNTQNMKITPVTDICSEVHSKSFVSNFWGALQ